jgi:hypothetical protein
MRMSRWTIVRPSASDGGKLQKLKYETTIEKIPLFGLFAALIILILPTMALSTEYQRAEEIAAASAEDAPAGLEDIERVPRVRPVRTLLGDVLKDAPPFWRDSSFELGIRTFDFLRENGIEPIAEATAVGTELAFRSGKWRDRISTVISWHTSNGVDAPEARGGTGMLAPDQSDLSVVSRAYLQYDAGSTASLRLYRQDFNMPYINRQDSRMIPNTHEAYVVRYPGETFQWIAGHITKMKQRDSEEFVPMGEVAGVEGNNAGTSVTVGAVVQHTDDLFTTAFSEATFRRTLTEDWSVQLGAQYTYQASAGDELLGRFDTFTWGLRNKISFRGAILTASYTRTGDEEIRKPFGGTPGFTSGMLYDFDRRKEEAYRLGLSFNFARLGRPGLAIIANYTNGRNARSADGEALPDADEFAVTADFRPQKGRLKGLWLRIRYADGDRGSSFEDRRDVRVILNYTLGVF